MADGGATLYLAYASAAAAAAGTAYSAYTASQNSKLQESQAKRDARLALNAAEQEAADLSERNRRITASQVAQYGAAGLLVEGTPADLILEDARRGELDVLNAASDGTNAASSRNFEARLFARNARTTLAAGAVSAAGQATGGISRANTQQQAQRRAEGID